MTPIRPSALFLYVGWQPENACMTSGFHIPVRGHRGQGGLGVLRVGSQKEGSVPTVKWSLATADWRDRPAVAMTERHTKTHTSGCSFLWDTCNQPGQRKNNMRRLNVPIGPRRTIQLTSATPLTARAVHLWGLQLPPSPTPSLSPLPPPSSIPPTSTCCS